MSAAAVSGNDFAVFIIAFDSISAATGTVVDADIATECLVLVEYGLTVIFEFVAKILSVCFHIQHSRGIG